MLTVTGKPIPGYTRMLSLFFDVMNCYRAVLFPATHSCMTRWSCNWGTYGTALAYLKLEFFEKVMLYFVIVLDSTSFAWHIQGSLHNSPFCFHRYFLSWIDFSGCPPLKNFQFLGCCFVCLFPDYFHNSLRSSIRLPLKQSNCPKVKR